MQAVRLLCAGGWAAGEMAAPPGQGHAAQPASTVHAAPRAAFASCGHAGWLPVPSSSLHSQIQATQSPTPTPVLTPAPNPPSSLSAVLPALSALSAVLPARQAMDRIHRLGQYKPIRVTRFVIGGTIEERILKLQASLGSASCARPTPGLRVERLLA